MANKIDRRQLLRLLLLGGTGGLIAACSSRLTQQPATPAVQSPATPTPLPLAAESLPAATDTPVPPPTPTQSLAATETPVALPTATEIPPTATVTNTATPVTPSLAAAITEAATLFLASLDDALRAKASYAFDDAERQRWHWTTPRGFPRNGLPLREMNPEQRELALALLQASVSEAGYRKALDIISLQNELGNDPELYYVTVFGTPGSGERWSWRFEGHHLSHHFTLAGERVVMTPFFLGAWPTITDAGFRAMPREEDAARELALSLDERGREIAIFQAATLTNHLTQNQPYVTPLDPVGLPMSELNPDQQRLVLEIVQSYLNSLPGDIATPIFERIRSAGLEQIRFGWAGSLEQYQPHYYRLQGPTFLLEFDNSRNRGTHIHSVWRDFEQDFGIHLT